MYDLKLKGLIAWTYFWDHKLKAFYPLGLNEKEEYLFKSHTQYLQSFALMTF